MFGSSVRTASSVRQRWCGVTSPVARTPAACARRRCSTDSRAERCIRCTRLPGLGGEVDVARDHQALAERRPAAETELGRDRARVRMAAARQRLLLAMDGDRPAGDRVVLQRAAHDARRRDGSAVVGEPDGARVGERAQLGELLARLTLRDRREEADRDMRLVLRARAQRRGATPASSTTGSVFGIARIAQ